MSINLLKPTELFFIALVISFVTSQGGISGAYLLLPIQSYILNTTNPVITSTNLMYNLVSIPLSIHRYVRERRPAMSLTLILIMSSSIGAVLGTWLRRHYLIGGYVFSYFMGSVLLTLAMELILSSLLIREIRIYEEVLRCYRRRLLLIITTTKDNTYKVNIPLLVIITVLVGIIGSAYGIGGASILSPILMGPMGLLAYVISGSTLIVTFIVSMMGNIVYVPWLSARHN
ncbi:hypothetical protein JCM16161A_24890 [Vulcanisaeta sp. JCM 16161]|uniref:sulfite exporter TauE/SafE family protein n=1 Tax=Vulcanisaeta sp. JCM 16161 TaxID=1295372 RepID=UPI000B288A94|nr:sulfite exporter TauE/SafE family protein [Vulcanisaeta sp. JCM 16161]